MSSKYKIWDQQGLNFITIRVVGWIDIFTRQRYKDILLKSFRYCQEEKGLYLWAYVIMSNHIHFIASVKHEQGITLSTVIRDFKKFTARQILDSVQREPESRREWLLELFKDFPKRQSLKQEYQFWKHDNHPIALWNQKIAIQKLNYIHQNPVKAGLVSEPEHYLYSSASNYFNRRGLIEVKNLLKDLDEIQYSKVKKD